MTFSEKKISLTISLANGSFDNGANSATLEGYRVSSTIKVPGGETQGAMECSVFGMSESLMNQLSTVGTQFNKIAQNKITLSAGDAASGMATVFQGTLFSAFVDGQSQPHVAFRVLAVPGYYEKVKPVPSTSVDGSADAAAMIKQLANQMGFQFENNGVVAKLASPYHSGSGLMQVKEITEAAGIAWCLENGTLAIWERGKGRGTDTIEISAETGMVGYPLFNQAQIIVKALFNPAIRYGRAIKVMSELKPAVGTWNINNLTHELDSQMPNGRWFTTIEALTAAPATKS